MSTGDIKNNLKKLQSELKAVKYEKDLDLERYFKIFLWLLCSLCLIRLCRYKKIMITVTRPIEQIQNSMNTYSKNEITLLF